MNAEVASFPQRHPNEAGKRYRFTERNAIESTNAALPSGIPAWNYLGVEVVKTEGAATAMGLAPATFRKRYNAGEIELEPVRGASGSLPALWAVDELVQLAAAEATRAHETRQQRYRRNRARQKPAGKA